MMIVLTGLVLPVVAGWYLAPVLLHLAWASYCLAGSALVYLICLAVDRYRMGV